MTDVKLYIEAGRMMGGEGLNVTIRDDDSRELLATFRLTGEQAWQLFGGATLHVDGSASPNLHRVGMQMVNDAVEYGFSAFPGYDRGEHLRLAEARAREDMPGWESYEPHATNYGVKVVVRRWEAAS